MSTAVHRKLATRLAQAGNRADTTTGAISVPIYQTASFVHPGLGQSTGFDYSRMAASLRSTTWPVDPMPKDYLFAY